jgi:hypothetical protein
MKSPERDVPLFHRVFLGNIRQFGRVFDVGMLGLYNLLSGHLAKDLRLAPKMFLKGKLRLLPPRNKHIQGVKELFAKAQALEGELE